MRKTKLTPLMAGLALSLALVGCGETPNSSTKQIKPLEISNTAGTSVQDGMTTYSETSPDGRGQVVITANSTERTLKYDATYDGKTYISLTYKDSDGENIYLINNLTGITRLAGKRSELFSKNVPNDNFNKSLLEVANSIKSYPVSSNSEMPGNSIKGLIKSQLLSSDYCESCQDKLNKFKKDYDIAYFALVGGIATMGAAIEATALFTAASAIAGGGSIVAGVWLNLDIVNQDEDDYNDCIDSHRECQTILYGPNPDKLTLTKKVNEDWEYNFAIQNVGPQYTELEYSFLHKGGGVLNSPFGAMGSSVQSTFKNYLSGGQVAEFTLSGKCGSTPGKQSASVIFSTNDPKQPAATATVNIDCIDEIPKYSSYRIRSAIAQGLTGGGSGYLYTGEYGYTFYIPKELAKDGIGGYVVLVMGGGTFSSPTGDPHAGVLYNALQAPWVADITALEDEILSLYQKYLVDNIKLTSVHVEPENSHGMQTFTIYFSIY